MKIFWSWQSDTPGKIGRFLIRDALNAAIEQLKETPNIKPAVRNDIEVDSDAQGLTGSPEIAQTILRKIDESNPVVADVTIVGEVIANGELRKQPMVRGR